MRRFHVQESPRGALQGSEMKDILVNGTVEAHITILGAQQHFNYIASAFFLYVPVRRAVYARVELSKHRTSSWS